jgi:hypothetical protein
MLLAYKSMKMYAKTAFRFTKKSHTNNSSVICISRLLNYYSLHLIYIVDTPAIPFRKDLTTFMLDILH